MDASENLLPIENDFLPTKVHVLLINAKKGACASGLAEKNNVSKRTIYYIKKNKYLKSKEDVQIKI